MATRQEQQTRPGDGGAAVAAEPEEQRQAEQRAEGICLHIFTTSAALVGVCLTVLGVFRAMVPVRELRSLGDDLLAMDALVFLVSCFVAYIALRTPLRARRERLERVADVLFLAGLSLMTLVCILLVYEVTRTPAPGSAG